jgi:hypothetical protein
VLVLMPMLALVLMLMLALVLALALVLVLALALGVTERHRSLLRRCWVVQQKKPAWP